MSTSEIPSPREAQQRLEEGNLRFKKAIADGAFQPRPPQRLNEAQRPFAIVLGCSDSRTPVEILFDQGFGDLFVVRVAGNVVAPSIVGSIEFAASAFGTRLVVVMGHTRCGAIAATVQALQTGSSPESKNIRSLTDRIAPHVESVVTNAPLELPEADLLRKAMLANVKASVDHLRHGSALLEELVLAGQVAVVGAEYDLDTGSVRFFETLK